MYNNCKLIRVKYYIITYILTKHFDIILIRITFASL